MPDVVVEPPGLAAGAGGTVKRPMTIPIKISATAAAAYPRRARLRDMDTAGACLAPAGRRA